MIIKKWHHPVHLVREFFIYKMELMIAKAILLLVQKKRTKEKYATKSNQKLLLVHKLRVNSAKLSVRTFRGHLPTKNDFKISK